MAQGEPPFRYVPPADPNIGRVVDGHRLESLLARGGMGVTYVAAHSALLRSKSVVKLVLAEIARHPQGIVRFQLEAEATSILKHDNLVKLLNFGVLEDGQLYLRFELIEGKSLERYVKEHGDRLDLRDAVYLIFQCCNALQYAHDMRVIHRDLKPDNIMIEFNPPGSTLKKRVKILDFGIARVAASAVDPTGSGVVLGTPRFMAPEQVTNAAKVSGAADVFAIGQVLYWMLTGTMPWGIPDSDIAIYHKQRTEAPAWPPEQLVPPAVATIIIRCLSLNPADRPTMRELAIALAAAIPAEDGLESGTQILQKIVPDWVTSSSHDADTLPRSAVADPTDSDPAQSGENDEPSLGAGAPTPSPSTPVPVQASPTWAVITANARPRALPALHASAAPGTFAASAGTPSTSAAPPGSLPSAPAADSSGQPSVSSSSPVLAALPTGLVSQRYPAQTPTSLEPATATRGTSIVVAAEIDLATGTPGPRPYAHAELPRVMVSNTQLTGVTAPPDTHAAQSPARPEPPPIVILDAAARPIPRRHLVALGLSALVVAVVVCLVVVRLASHASARASHESATPARGSDRVLTVAAATDAGVASPEPHLVASAATAHADAGHPALAVDASNMSIQPPRAPGDTKARPAPLDAETRSIAPSSTQRTPPAPDAAPSGQLKSTPQAQPTATKKGELVVEVDTWAVIWLNGKQDEAPYRAKVAAGRYRLRLQHEEKDETMTVVVRSGETTIVKRNW